LVGASSAAPLVFFFPARATPHAPRVPRARRPTPRRSPAAIDVRAAVIAAVIGIVVGIVVAVAVAVVVVSRPADPTHHRRIHPTLLKP
jgi:hypothetical protein